MATKERKKKVSAELIKKAYEDYAVRYQFLADDLASFCKEAGFSLTQFEEFYDSLKEVHVDIWKSFVEETLTVLAEDPQYGSFTVREQLLSFYYTHLEILKQHRDFIKIVDSEFKRPLPTPYFIKEYRNEFVEFGKQLIQAGTETGEVANRRIINKTYTNGLWAQLLFVVKFWIKDTSPDFEKTDAAVEKAVSLSFELVRPGPLDSIVDFAKFVYQNRK